MGNLHCCNIIREPRHTGWGGVASHDQGLPTLRPSVPRLVTGLSFADTRDRKLFFVLKFEAQDRQIRPSISEGEGDAKLFSLHLQVLPDIGIAYSPPLRRFRFKLIRYMVQKGTTDRFMSNSMRLLLKLRLRFQMAFVLSFVFCEIAKCCAEESGWVFRKSGYFPFLP